MTMTREARAEREAQVRQAQELLFSGPAGMSFAKALFFGQCLSEKLFPYPQPSPEESAEIGAFVSQVRGFCDEHLDPAEIDRKSTIPAEVMAGLGRLGVLGMTVPREYGGLGLSQTAFCRAVEEIGSRCSGTSVFVNAHLSIGLRALVLFGTEEQKRRWLPPLARGEQLAAFALTEPNAGSDAAGIETRAELNRQGTHYILNGRKQWITNGSIAGVLTVMAKTPVADNGRIEPRVTAFLVTPDMPGFKVTEAKLDKCGIRGTTTSKLEFTDMAVPVENVLGTVGKGLRVALTVLDFGRTAFGASCTGAAKRLVGMAVEHAKTRRQFGRALAEFPLVKKKLARMAAYAWAMDAATYATAAQIDRGEEDYMVETAILKVFACDGMWLIVNDTIQILGGRAYFTDLPYERMMRDARINFIGEGSNEVLRCFIALVGMRGVGENLRGVLGALKNPIEQFGTLSRFVRDRWDNFARGPEVPLRSPRLQGHKAALEGLLGDFRGAVERSLRKYREEIIEEQYTQERIADAAIELYVMSCVLAKLDRMLGEKGADTARLERDLTVGLYYCREAEHRVRRALGELSDNYDSETTRVADTVVGSQKGG